jgi:hypothetical protein
MMTFQKKVKIGGPQINMYPKQNNNYFQGSVLCWKPKQHPGFLLWGFRRPHGEV